MVQTISVVIVVVIIFIINIFCVFLCSSPCSKCFIILSHFHNNPKGGSHDHHLTGEKGNRISRVEVKLDRYTLFKHKEIILIYTKICVLPHFSANA